MKQEERNRVCPVELSGGLDVSFRKFLHNPQKILGSHIREGMSVLDVGCGPGYFSVEIARMVGPSGKVTAADLQDGMLQKVREKIRDTELESVIELHQCRQDAINIAKKFDLVFVFYMLHEVPDQRAFLEEIASLLNEKGKILIVEPKVHVSKKDFMNIIETVAALGFEIIDNPKIFFSRSLVIQKNR